MLNRIVRRMKKVGTSIKNFFVDPPLDILGAGVLGSMMGRGFMYVSFSAAFYATAMFWQSGIILAVLAFDMIIHIETLSALRRLMGYEVLTEVVAQGYDI